MNEEFLKNGIWRQQRRRALCSDLWICVEWAQGHIFAWKLKFDKWNTKQLKTFRIDFKFDNRFRIAMMYLMVFSWFKYEWKSILLIKFDMKTVLGIFIFKEKCFKYYGSGFWFIYLSALFEIRVTLHFFIVMTSRDRCARLNKLMGT